MKAVVYERYGPPEVLQLKEVEQPTPGQHELLVKVHATTVRSGDWRLRKPEPAAARLFNGLFRPRRVKVLGMELAGEVEAVGPGVQRFTPGDAVFAACGLRFGGYAQYACLPEDGVVAVKPANLSLEEAAAVPAGALAALALLRDRGKIQPGQQVMIYGASGSVGTYAVQIARSFGTEITAVCSTANLRWVQALGAHKLIDYTQEDFWRTGTRFDLAFDAVGKMVSGLPKARFREVLAPGGTYVSIGMDYEERADDLREIKAMVEAGQVRPVIDRSYALADIVEAHRYVQQGHKKGNVVIVVGHGKDA